MPVSLTGHPRAVWHVLLRVRDTIPDKVRSTLLLDMLRFDQEAHDINAELVLG